MGEVGNELARSALQMQEIKNETEANNASTNYITQSGESQEKFQNLLGEEPHQKLDAHLADLSKSRMDIRGSLSNDAVRRAFDSQTLGAFRQNVIRSGGHAASQLKQANFHSGEAVIAMNERGAANDETDEQFNDRIGRMKQAVEGMRSSAGYTSSMVANRQQAEEQKLQIARVRGMADRSPTDAEKYLEQQKGKLDLPQYNQINEYVQGKVRPVVATNAESRVNAQPEGQGDAPNWNPTSVNNVNLAIRPVQDVARIAARDNPDMRFQVTGGNWNGLDVTSTDIEGDIKKFQKAAASFGAPVTVTERDGKIHFEIAGEADLSTIPVAPAEDPNSRRDRGIAYATEQRPNDALIPKVVSDRITQGWNAARTREKQIVDSNKKLVMNAIAAEDGIKPANVEELTAKMDQMNGNHNAWDALAPADKQRFIDHNLNTDAFRSDDQEKTRLRGYNDEEVYHMDPNKEILENRKLSRADKNILFNRYINVTHNGDKEDPMIGKAMSLANLPADMDKDDKHLYRGLLQDVLNDWLGAHQGQRTVPPKEMQVIAKQVLNTMVTDKMFGVFPIESELYKYSASSEEREKARTDPKWEQYGYTPSDEDLDRHVRVEKFKAAHAKPKEANIVQVERDFNEEGVPERPVAPPTPTSPSPVGPRAAEAAPAPAAPTPAAPRGAALTTAVEGSRPEAAKKAAADAKAKAEADAAAAEAHRKDIAAKRAGLPAQRAEQLRTQQEAKDKQEIADIEGQLANLRKGAETSPIVKRELERKEGRLKFLKGEK
jgi:protein-tyrosine-phosphatase